MSPPLPALIRAGLIGAATGLRSTSGVTVLVCAAPAVLPSGSWAARLARPGVRAVALAGAAAEFVTDKSPRTPDRLSPGGLAPRVALGAVTGGVLANSRTAKRPTAAGAAAGAAAAVAAGYAGERWRTVRDRQAGRDCVAAALEDVASLTLAAGACTWAATARRRAYTAAEENSSGLWETCSSERESWLP
ncbi:hypothetical protein [Streptomyces sp. AA1529]|uniref:hypothetical protein n=1 Tax=Streptomyces sp. AA1529 TaxID=1203257 RepID=UPI0002DF506B|nr:hypothetical protein [Streptomyces sp. AA1529]